MHVCQALEPAIDDKDITAHIRDDRIIEIEKFDGSIFALRLQTRNLLKSNESANLAANHGVNFKSGHDHP